MLAAEDHMYLMICEFLLLKPSLDVANVPEFYKLFYSASLEVTYQIPVLTLLAIATTHAVIEFFMPSNITLKTSLINRAYYQ